VSWMVDTQPVPALTHALSEIAVTSSCALATTHVLTVDNVPIPHMDHNVPVIAVTLEISARMRFKLVTARPAMLIRSALSREDTLSASAQHAPCKTQQLEFVMFKLTPANVTTHART